MTRDDIIRMAREAGFYGSEILGDHEYDVVGLVSDLERFATIVAAIEREVCAKICESVEMFCDEYDPCYGADMIRARGNNDV